MKPTGSALRADRLALVVVRAAAEALGVHRRDHGVYARSALRLALRQEAQVRDLRARRRGIAEAFVQAATQAPQPMQAAASMARSASGFGIGIALRVGRAARRGRR